MKIITLFKKVFLLIITLPILLSGCYNASVNNVDISAPKKIRWGIVKYNPYIMEINSSSEVISYIEQKFNCKIEFEYYDTFNTKILNYMVNNETCPDILTMETLSIEGQFLAKNDLVLTADEIISDVNHTIPDSTALFLSEIDENLFGIPGRYATENQLKENNFPANEGIYVAQPYYNLLGRPRIESISDLLKISETFIANYDSLQNSANAHFPKRQSDADAIPIILGNSGSGIETLKHLFEIYPVFSQDNAVKHSIASPNWEKLVKWLDYLSKLSIKSMSLTGETLENALNGRSLFYIGSSACINDFNFESNNFNYELLELDVSENTFSVNPYGSCQTYVFKNRSGEQTIKELIRFLLSEDGSLLTKYGIANKHWILSGNTPIQLKWVTERMETEYDVFLNDTGIGQLLFLTSLKNDNPNTKDVLSSEKNAFYTMVLDFTCSSDDMIKLEKLSNYELDLCQRVASLSRVSYPQKQSLIESVIKNFSFYEQQYKIPSLKERFDYWIKQGLHGIIV